MQCNSINLFYNNNNKWRIFFNSFIHFARMLKEKWTKINLILSVNSIESFSFSCLSLAGFFTHKRTTEYGRWHSPAEDREGRGGKMGTRGASFIRYAEFNRFFILTLIDERWTYDIPCVHLSNISIDRCLFSLFFCFCFSCNKSKAEKK